MSEIFNLKSFKESLAFDADSTALYCPNPAEWYSRAYLVDNYEDMRVIPNIKESRKISRIAFGGTSSVLYEFDCGFTEGDSKLDAVTIEAKPYSVMHTICQRDIEETFVVESITQGNENWKNETVFFAHYWEALAAKVSEDIAIAKWQGQNQNGFVIVGLEELITTSSDTIGLTSSAFTVANIESVFENALMAAPSTISRKKKDLRFYVSPSTMNKIAIAMAKNNTTNYVTSELKSYYAGIKISEQEGMSDDLVVLTRKDNLIIGVDALGDAKNLKIRDLDVINIPKIRTRVDGKLATKIVNDEEIVYVEVV